MESILEHYESDSDADQKKSQETKSTQESDLTDKTDLLRTSESHESDMDEKDYQSVAQAIEDNLMNLSETDGGSDAAGETGADVDDIKLTNNEEKSDTDGTDSKPTSISFDEDIILPSVRHDTEEEQQKQRDRIKRKEMKSRKEMEEEEREKMQ